ncbi:Uncharacterized conserved protein [Plasmopara halstedii]|uniref:Uncharacterized conserved protein n=1 Tax=Plasmopara halstedii TaxID=4781 RepID=A0A0P1AKD1_PLAHL|nr:Uncharacterized conserved protein [Plasmopara halstedii]CEG41568.1 Uncharacterized conserved protein [Plasmopara halstedii]|eukprot:XP_024577937.1 Uncharacterized conserved protein [Plasmopara halstedii]
MLSSAHRPAWNAFLESKLFFKAPSDVYNVFGLALELRPTSPCEAFVDTLGLRLIGLFDLLAAAEKNKVTVDKPLYLHGRFFFDPPEVAAVMLDSDSNTGRHWGYFRDAPDQIPEYIVCAEKSNECKFDIAGSSLFDVLETRLQTRQSTLGDYEAANLSQKIKDYRTEKLRSQAWSVSALQDKRSKDIVAASLHQLGIVVPVDTTNNTGYRELPVSGQDLVDLLQQFQSDESSQNRMARNKLSELMTRVTIASDECDFGTGLLLGLDFFTTGSCLEKEALQLLQVAYTLLDRMNYYNILSGHCKYRNKCDFYTCIESLVAPSNVKRSRKENKQETFELPPPLFNNGGK